MRSTPAFPADFDDYLVVQGWSLANSKRDGYMMYTKKDCCLIVNGDTIDLLIRQPEPLPNGPALEVIHSFTGWSGLGFFAFTLLMHIMDAVPLNSFLTKVKKEVTTNVGPFEPLLRHFRVADHKGIPEAY